MPAYSAAVSHHATITRWCQTGMWCQNILQGLETSRGPAEKAPCDPRPQAQLFSYSTSEISWRLRHHLTAQRIVTSPLGRGHDRSRGGTAFG
jgi:hypothetical protein